MHEWLKKNNYPLPHNITLHESVLTEDDEEPNEDAPVYDYTQDDSMLSRMKRKYGNSRWGQILQNRWKDLGKVVDQMSSEERAEKLRQNSWNDTYRDMRKLSREKSKENMFKTDIKQVANPYKDQSPLEPRMVYNDLRSGMGDFLDDKDSYNTRIKELRKNNTSRLKKDDKEKSEKTEAIDNNQLDNNEVWYLEYQTNIPEEKSYLNSAWREADLLSDNLENAAKFISRDNAMAELQELYAFRQTAFPFKPITTDTFEECGVACATTTGALGSAVQHVCNKKKEESFDEDVEQLDEVRRTDVKDRSALNKELIKIANIKDFNGNIIGKAGKKIYEYADANELGFSEDEDGDITFTQDGKTFKVADTLKNRRVALNITTDQPIGMIDTTGKVRSLRGKEIGYSDTREAAKNRGIDLDKLDVISTEDDTYQFDQKAGAHWRNDVNAVKFMDKNGSIRDKYADAWHEVSKDNQKLRANPELLQTMFGGYFEKGKIVDPELFKKRVLEINDTLGLAFNAEDEMFSPRLMKDKQRQEYEKWRDTYYKPFFNASRRKNKAADKINADRENFAKEQDEWRASANDRAEQEQSIQYFVKDMQDANQQFINGEIGGKDLRNKFASIASNDAIPTHIKNKLANDTYQAFASYDDDMADMFKDLNSQYFPQNESILTEDDTPADFADGPTNIASNMASATTGAADTADTSTTDVIPDAGLDDYGPEELAGAPSFGDINIGGSMGNPEDEEVSMPQTENKRIIDVLVNEADPSQIKLKVKNMDTGEIEVKDLAEIDI